MFFPHFRSEKRTVQILLRLNVFFWENKRWDTFTMHNVNTDKFKKIVSLLKLWIFKKEKEKKRIFFYTLNEFSKKNPIKFKWDDKKSYTSHFEKLSPIKANGKHPIYFLKIKAINCYYKYFGGKGWSCLLTPFACGHSVSPVH